MTMDFSGSAGAASPFDNIPIGQLAWANLSVRGVKASGSGGGYIDCELTIDAGQPYAGRKIWDMIGDPRNQGNSEKYRQMGTIAITRILEAGRGAGPHNMAAYQINEYSDLDGLRVPIKIGIEAGTGGHQDKNRVSDYLTPNPASQSGHKLFALLQSGVFNAAGSPPANAPGAGGFGAPGGAAPVAGFGAPAAAPAPASTFGAPAPAATPASGFGLPATAPAPGVAEEPQPGFQAAPVEAGATATPAAIPSGAPLASPPATMTSPSDPGATPNWLSQAGGAPQVGA